jgi:hypothetical protein
MANKYGKKNLLKKQISRLVPQSLNFGIMESLNPPKKFQSDTEKSKKCFIFVRHFSFKLEKLLIKKVF